MYIYIYMKTSMCVLFIYIWGLYENKRTWIIHGS